jgi:insertion element IS1 protein InsB
MLCPSCGSERTIKNGTIHNGKQKYECKQCSRQFVDNPQNKIIVLRRSFAFSGYERFDR